MRKTALVFAVFLFTISFGYSQENRFDVALGAVGGFQKQVTGSGVTLTSTDNVGVLASLRWRLAPRYGIELNYARTPNAQTFNAPPYIFRLQNISSEYTGAFVFSFLKRDKYEPFALGGVGDLSFYPKTIDVNGVQTSLYESRQNRLAFLYGGGVDYKVYSHVAVRLQYRGLLYKAQDYKLSRLFTGVTGHLAEPSVGIVFRF